MTWDHVSSNLLLLLSWYGALTVLQVAALPLTASVFRRLPDGGSSLSKLTGLAVTGFVLWSAWAYGLVANDRSAAWSTAVVVGVACWAIQLAVDRQALVAWIRSHLPLIAVCELVFLAGFLTLAAIRTIAPQVRHTEQPMDLMMLTSLWSSPEYPPHDAWLSGFPVSYYYFGYWLQLLAGRLSGIAPDITYNLGLATLFGFLTAGLFGLGFNLVRSSCLRSSARLRSSYTGGFLAVVLTACAGNFRSLYDLAVHASHLDRWWWLSSRALHDVAPNGVTRPVITEFPAFSYLLGDNHPHLQSSSLLLMAAAVAMSRMMSSDASVKRVRPGLTRLSFSAGTFLESVLFPAFVLAAVTATNSWDAPVAFALVCLGCWFSKNGSAWSKLARVGIRCAGIAAVALLMLTPLLQTLRGKVFGILPNLFNSSDPLRFLSAMGPGFLATCALLFVLYRRRAGWRSAAWIGGLALLALVGIALVTLNAMASPQWNNWLNQLGLDPSLPFWPLALRRWALHFLVAGGLLVALGVVLSQRIKGRFRRENVGLQMGLILTVVSICLLLAPELVFVHDIFHYRVNTVFKLHYGAWILLGPVGAYALTRLAATRRHRGKLCLLGFASSAALLYPLFAFWPLTFGNVPPQYTLSAKAALGETEPQLLDALEWIDSHTPHDAVVVEAPGAAQDPLSCPVSTYTGRATLLGWQDHELQWRPEQLDSVFTERTRALESIYRTESASMIEALAGRYEINFIVQGPRERVRYGDESKGLERLGAPVFQSKTYRVYATGRRKAGFER